MKRVIVLFTFVLSIVQVHGQVMNVRAFNYTQHLWANTISHIEFDNIHMAVYGTSENPHPVEQWEMEDVDSITFCTKEELPYFVPEEGYESIDFSKNGQIARLQLHEEGVGIPLVIIGDAFSDRMFDMGIYDYFARQAMEAFFAQEPYTTFRNYFDVYSINAVSKKEVTCKDTALGLGMENHFTQESRTILENYVKAIPELNGSLKDVTVILVSNLSPDYHGSYYTTYFGDNFNVAQTCIELTTAWYSFNDFLVQHEAGGHAFGLLMDERVNDNATETFPESDRYLIDDEHSEGVSYNIDYHDTPETSFWKDFLLNPDYEVEQLGLYEGAMYNYARGIYRPSETSIMYGSFEWANQYYNAPSRWAIYRRIMQLAGKECSFDNFSQYDKKNLEKIKVQNENSREAVKPVSEGLFPIRRKCVQMVPAGRASRPLRSSSVSEARP